MAEIICGIWVKVYVRIPSVSCWSLIASLTLRLSFSFGHSETLYLCGMFFYAKLIAALCISASTGFASLTPFDLPAEYVQPGVRMLFQRYRSMQIADTGSLNTVLLQISEIVNLDNTTKCLVA
jgi:hypothetical protein